MKQTLLAIGLSLLFLVNANAQWTSGKSNDQLTIMEGSFNNIFGSTIGDSTLTLLIISADGDTVGIRGQFQFWRNGRYVPQDSLYTIAQIVAYVTGLNYITSSGVTAANLDGNSGIGTGSGQAARGNHNHTGVYSTPTEVYSTVAAVVDTYTVAVNGTAQALWGDSTGGVGWQSIDAEAFLDSINLIRGQTVAGSNGDAVVLTSANTWSQADADTLANSAGWIGIRVSATTVMPKGTYVTSGLTAGATYYLSTTAGGITTTAPTGSTDIRRIIGYAKSTTELYVDPDKSYTVNN